MNKNVYIPLASTGHLKILLTMIRVTLEHIIWLHSNLLK